MLCSYFSLIMYKSDVREMTSGEEELREIRERIDEIDDAIADLLSKRMRYAQQAKDVKVRMNRPLADMERENEVIDKWCMRAGKRRSADCCLNAEMMRQIAELVIRYTLKEEQEE